MEFLTIELPDKRDSLSRVVLGNTPYQLRMTYLSEGDCWMLGLYDARRQPVLQGMKVVPNFPLNLYGGQAVPGVFVAVTKLPRIGRDAFRTGAAKLRFVPIDREEA